MQENRELNDPTALLIKAEGIGNGSGFFVKENLIATNIHVVAAATSVSAELVATKTEFIVEGVAAFDAKNDLVILKIAGEGVSLPLGDSDLVKSGDIVQAIGYPNRRYEITEGPIHSIRNSDKWIQIKAKISNGNSGGPALNRKSEVIGVVVASDNFGSYAIPVNILKVLLARIQTIEPFAQWQERERIRAYAYLAQSKKKHIAGHYKEAITDIDKAIQLNSDYLLLYTSIGLVKCDLGRSKVEAGSVVEAQQFCQGAIDDHTTVIKLCPDYVSAYDNRGTAKCYLGQSKVESGNEAEAQQHYQDAIADYKEAIKLCPDYASAYNNQAEAKRLLGKSEDAAGNVKAARNLYQEAIVDINTAIELDSNNAVFYHTRGQIDFVLGDSCAAIEDYERARVIDPNYTDVCKDLELAKEVLKQQKESKNK